MARLIAELSKDHLSGIFYTYADINFLHFAIFLFILCSVVLIVVSFFSQPPSNEKISGLTYATATKSEVDPSWKKKDVLLSIILAAVVGCVWLYFTG